MYISVTNKILLNIKLVIMIRGFHFITVQFEDILFNKLVNTLINVDKKLHKASWNWEINISIKRDDKLLQVFLDEGKKYVKNRY